MIRDYDILITGKINLLFQSEEVLVDGISITVDGLPVSENNM